MFNGRIDFDTTAGLRLQVNSAGLFPVETAFLSMAQVGLLPELILFPVETTTSLMSIVRGV